MKRYGIKTGADTSVWLKTLLVSGTEHNAEFTPNPEEAAQTNIKTWAESVAACIPAGFVQALPRKRPDRPETKEGGNG